MPGPPSHKQTSELYDSGETMTDRKLKKEAQIGTTIFHKGVSERLVIQRAQREYEYWHDPERVKQLDKDVAAARALIEKREARRKKRRSAALGSKSE
jgi:hypothetical protein